MDIVHCKKCKNKFDLDELSIQEFATLKECCLNRIDQERENARFEPVYPAWLIRDLEDRRK